MSSVAPAVQPREASKGRALLVALRRPDPVRRLVLVAGVFHRDGCTGIPDAELAVVPGTSHGLLVEKPDLCNRMIVDFLTTEPVRTIAPIRRAIHVEQA